MKTKFWSYYLAFVLFLCGMAYVAISDDTDMPLALSDSEMAELRGTGSDERCIRSSEPGCDNTSCQPPDYKATYGYRYNECQSYNGWTCSYRGPHSAQTLCRTVPYDSGCQNAGEPEDDTSSDCVSHQ